MDIYMKIKLTIGLLYFLQTLTYIQGEYTYTYVGCFKDRWLSRAISETHYKDDITNTIEKCVNFCGEKGYTYAGLQFSTECWCGNEGYNKYGSRNGCTHRCPGNYDQICGGSLRNSVYSISEVIETATTRATAAKEVTSSAATSPTAATTATFSVPTNTEGSASAKTGDKANTGVYIGIAMITLVVCAIIVLVVVLVVRRRRYSRENNGISCQMTVSNIYVDVPSASQSDKPTSGPKNDTTCLHYSVANGDVYSLPQRSSENNQSADNNCEDEQVYSIAEHIIDDLVVVDNLLYQ